MVWTLWGFVELLLLRLALNPLRMVMDRERYYQDREFNDAVADFTVVVVAGVIVSVMALIAG